MPIPTSGAISLNDIQTEFGGSNPISINEYYAGGSSVSSRATGTNGDVPSSGQISLSNFYGTTSYWATGVNTGSQSVEPRSIATSSTAVYLLFGEPNNTKCGLVKFNKATGALIWNKTVTNAGYYGSISIDSSENIYVATHNGAFNAVAFKFDSSGNLTWARQLNMGGSVGGCFSALDSSGNFYLSTAFYDGTGGNGRLVKLDSNGNAVWARLLQNPNLSIYTEPGQVVIGGPNNYVYVFATIKQSSNTNAWPAFWIFDQSGNLIAYRHCTVIPLGSTHYRSYGGSGAVDSSGNIYMGVRTDQVSVFNYSFLVKFNSSYTKLWERRRSPRGYLSTLFLNSDNSISQIIYEPSFVDDLGTSPTYRKYNAPIWPGYTVDVIDTSGSTVSTTNYASHNSGSVSSTFALEGNSIMYYSTYSTTQPTNGNAFGFKLLKIRQTGHSGYVPLFNSSNGVYASTTSAAYVSNNVVTLVSATPSTSTSPLTSTAITPTVTTPTMTATNNLVGYSIASGSNIYAVPGTYTWVAPSGVTSVSVVAVGGGGAGGFTTGGGGGGGGLGYLNNYSVTPGSSYTVTVGAGGNGGFSPTNGGASFFVNTSTVRGGGGNSGINFNGAGGTYTGTGGGNGGAGAGGFGGGGGGAGGYLGNGGAGVQTGNGFQGSGGGGGGGAGGPDNGNGVNNGYNGGSVGILGVGNSGAGGVNGDGGDGSTAVFQAGYGGGCGGQFTYFFCCVCNTEYFPANGGGDGIVRIIWPGNSRTFPYNNLTTP